MKDLANCVMLDDLPDATGLEPTTSSGLKNRGTDPHSTAATAVLLTSGAMCDFTDYSQSLNCYI